MTSSEELHQRLDQAEAEMRAAEEAYGKFQDIQPEIEALVGRGEGADGLVRVGWGPEGLQDVELDPRAMRLPSADLAAALKTAINNAMGDLQNKALDLMRDSGVVPPDTPTVEETQARLAEFREMTIGDARKTADELGRMERMRQEYDERQSRRN